MSSKMFKRLAFVVLFLLGIFAIFFVGREFDAETGERNFTLTSRGREHFRKGLDVNGGSRLVYRISYDTYEELYDNPAELQSIKATIETIVLKNIDARISKLGVSDYRSYTQNVNGENYIIVEIGGVADLEYAKEIIGKVVQLQFRLPNDTEPTVETIAERKDKAKSLLNDILASPEMMQDLADGKQGEDIYYNNLDTVKLTQLPEVYQENADLLETIEIGKVYPGLLEGNHFPGYTVENDEYVTEDNHGFIFFRVNDRQVEEKTTVNAEDAYALMQQFDLDYSEDYTADDQGIATGSYNYNENTLKINLGKILEGSDGYQIKIYEYASNSEIGSGVAAVDQNLLNEIKNAIVGEENLDGYAGLSLMADGWATSDELQQRISSFVDQEVGTTEVYNELGTQYFVKVEDKKSATENLYRFVSLSNILDSDRSKIEELLKKSVIYSIEDVFVKDKESWVAALDTKTNKILNGAYFKYATIGRSQVGEPVVYINLDDQGKEIFCNITEANINNQMAIFVGGELKTAPNIRTKICGGTAQIEGGFTSEEAKQLADDLNEGNMPAPLILMQEEKISPSLGANALRGALIAGIVGIIAIVLLIWLMYGYRKAVVTLGVLLMFVTVLLGFMKLIDYALSLSGIAAVILSIGMGVDANILIFERVREELKDGKTIKSAIETGYRRSRAPIRDGNVSTGLIALLLFMIGLSVFKGFGSMMILNILLILFINVPLTKELLQLLFHRKKTYLKEDGKILK